MPKESPHARRERMKAEGRTDTYIDLNLPETPESNRFFAARDSGYKGWIDQNGYPCDENGKRVT